MRVLLTLFQTQRDPRWFADHLLKGLLRPRGVESNSPDRDAEGFYGRKVVL
jgi:hypothetical protein